MKKETLYKYFAGETSSQEEKEIMDWTDNSPENFQSYLKERKLWNAVLVNYKLQTPSGSPKPKKSINHWMLSTVAASVAIFFLVFSQVISSPDLPNDKWQSVWVPPGQRSLVTLDDGTKVWLNSQSTLSFPVSFNTDKRIVELNGEGYFDVAKNEDAPFIVKTSKYNIEVLGTSFNVLAYESNDLFETSLLNGSVMIKSVTNDSPTIKLNPNEKITLIAGALQMSRIENFNHFRWREGLICLDDERFEDLIKKFSLYFDIHIEIENPELKDYLCTGKFRHSDGVDYALKVLQAEMKFTYTRDNEHNAIYIR